MCLRLSLCACPATGFLHIVHRWHVYSEQATRFSECLFGGVKAVISMRHSLLSGQVNVQSNNYWSGTEFAPNTNNAWNFNFNNGNQNINNKNNNLFAWAVQSGE